MFSCFEMPLAQVAGHGHCQGFLGAELSVRGRDLLRGVRDAGVAALRLRLALLAQLRAQRANVPTSARALHTARSAPFRNVHNTQLNLKNF